MVKYLDDGDDAGTVLGQDSSELIAFWGATPAAQPSSASQAAVTATAVTALATATISAANTSTVFGFANSTVAQAYVGRVDQMQVDLAAVIVLANQLRSELVTMGLISGAA